MSVINIENNVRYRLLFGHILILNDLHILSSLNASCQIFKLFLGDPGIVGYILIVQFF